jgi:hypothetical protein
LGGWYGPEGTAAIEVDPDFYGMLPEKLWLFLSVKYAGSAENEDCGKEH